MIDNSHLIVVDYLKGYVLYRRPVLALSVASWGSWCLHFGTLGTILAPREHLGGPWEQKDGHERVQNQTVIDSKSIWESYLQRVGIEAQNFNFFSGLFSGRFFYTFQNRHLVARGTSHHVST